MRTAGRVRRHCERSEPIKGSAAVGGRGRVIGGVLDCRVAALLAVTAAVVVVACVRWGGLVIANVVQQSRGLRRVDAWCLATFGFLDMYRPWRLFSARTVCDGESVGFLYTLPSGVQAIFFKHMF